MRKEAERFLTTTLSITSNNITCALEFRRLNSLMVKENFTITKVLQNENCNVAFPPYLILTLHFTSSLFPLFVSFLFPFSFSVSSW